MNRPARPLALTCSLFRSFSRMIHMWRVPRTWDLYGRTQPSDMPITTYEQAPADPHSERLRWAIGASEIDLTEQQIVAARRAYYASVTDFDRRVGLVMKKWTAVEAARELDSRIDHILEKRRWMLARGEGRDDS